MQCRVTSVGHGTLGTWHLALLSAGMAAWRARPWDSPPITNTHSINASFDFAPLSLRELVLEAEFPIACPEH